MALTIAEPRLRPTRELVVRDVARDDVGEINERMLGF